MLRNFDCQNCETLDLTCFSILKKEDLEEVNRVKVTNLYKKGQIIFYEGMNPTGVYCVNKGKVKVSKVGYDGKEQIVRFVLDGGLLGIRALLGDRPYTATATTLEDSVVCFINKETFLEVLTRYPEIKQCMIRLLSRLLEEAENKITSLAQKPVRERLAESLLTLHQVFLTDNSVCDPPSDNGNINLSREDLANMVGTATETVIRLLSEFKEEGLIAINGRSISLLDIEELQKIGKIYR
jgi:CRP/FNR family transcriptional regulator